MSYDCESFAYIRGEWLFDELVDAVKRIRAAGIHAHMLPTLHMSNIQDVPDYAELSKRLGCTVGFSLLSGARADLGELMPDDSCLAAFALGNAFADGAPAIADNLSQFTLSSVEEIEGCS